MITHSNRSVWPIASPEYTGQAPTLTDIAVGLARTIRFAGQTDRVWSVLDHSLIVAGLVDPKFTKHALLHDAHEAIIGDMPTTWKRFCPEFDELSKELDDLIFRENGVHVTPESSAAVRWADAVALAAEAHALGHRRAEFYWPALAQDEKHQAVVDVVLGRTENNPNQPYWGERLHSKDEAVTLFAQAWMNA
jgi:hypothetical protein